MTDNRQTQIQTYLRNDLVMENFAQALGSGQSAGAYISSVLIQVRQNPRLMECNLISIYASALRAATLRLSVDPATRQAYLVPYKNVCTLIVGYKGLYDLAIRTNRYQLIHTSRIFEGEDWYLDRATGVLVMEGQKESNLVTGWMAYFKMAQQYGGLEKWELMTKVEIHNHKQRYAKGYQSPDSAWNTATEAMERKTVLRRLLTNWGYMEPSDVSNLSIVEGDQEQYDDIEIPKLPEVVETEESQQSAQQDLADVLGKDVQELNGGGEWTQESE